VPRPFQGKVELDIRDSTPVERLTGGEIVKVVLQHLPAATAPD